MDATDVLIKIRKIFRSINLESKKIQKEYGVSIPQVLCLNFLKSSPDFHATQGDVRKFLNLNSSTASGIIDRLENKGMVARLPRTGDKRVVNIVLTSKGAEILEQMPPILHVQLSQKLALLPKEKLNNIHESLDTLIQLLNIDQLEASPLLSIEELPKASQKDLK